MIRKFLASLFVFAIGITPAFADNYNATAGSGLTFGAKNQAGTLYPYFVGCDATTAAQCWAVDASGRLTVNVAAGTNIIGKVGIDQTTPGTTNLVAAGQNGTWNVNATLQATATTAIGKVDPNTLATWGLVGATTSGATAATNALQAAGVYSSSAPTLTNGQAVALQLTSAGSLHTTVDNTNANGSATSANSSPVVIASDQAAVAVKAASGAIASGAIASGALASGSISSGAAVSGAFVAGAIADLAHGQATMANSVPVAIASNQSAVPVSAASGAIASGAVASGAFASGAVSSGAYASGSLASGAVVDITNMSVATGSAPPSKAIYNGTLQSGATSGFLKGSIQCDTHAFVHVTSATDTLLVQGVASQTIRVCGMLANFSGSAAQSIYLENTASTNANCSSTKTQIAGLLTGNSTAPLSTGFHNALWSGLANTSGNGLCLNSSGTGGVDVDVWYTQF